MIDSPHCLATPGELRKYVNALSERETAIRKEDNPQKTPIELRIGAYLEELEPQVRSLIVMMNELDLPTFTSGFDCTDIRFQMVSGNFRLKGDLRKPLYQMGVRSHVDRARVMLPYRYPNAPTGHITTLRFRPKVLTLTAITEDWKRIEDVIAQGYR